MLPGKIIWGCPEWAAGERTYSRENTCLLITATISVWCQKDWITTVKWVKTGNKGMGQEKFQRGNSRDRAWGHGSVEEWWSNYKSLAWKHYTNPICWIKSRLLSLSFKSLYNLTWVFLFFPFPHITLYFLLFVVDYTSLSTWRLKRLGSKEWA